MNTLRVMKSPITSLAQLGTTSFLLFAVFSASLMAADSKAGLTNASVISMLKADIPADTVVLAIEGSPGKFDISPEALIELKNSGATQKVLDAVIRKTSGAGEGTDVAKENVPLPGTNPVATVGTAVTPSLMGTAWLMDGTNRIQMKLTTYNLTDKSRVNWKPFGGPVSVDMVQLYQGARAALRLRSAKPSFEFSIPGDLQVSQVVQLYVLKINKKDDYRELRVSKGGTMKTGLLKESVVPVSLEELKTDNAYGLRTVTYRASPTGALKVGEYVLTVSGTEYDFGVD